MGANYSEKQPPSTETSPFSANVSADLVSLTFKKESRSGHTHTHSHRRTHTHTLARVPIVLPNVWLSTVRTPPSLVQSRLIHEEPLDGEKNMRERPSRMWNILTSPAACQRNMQVLLFFESNKRHNLRL